MVISYSLFPIAKDWCLVQRWQTRWQFAFVEKALEGANTPTYWNNREDWPDKSASRVLELQSFNNTKWQNFVDKSKDMPSFCDIDFWPLFTDGWNDLIGYFLDRHNPKQVFSLCHSCVNKTWSDVCYGYTTTILESLFPNCFHIIYLVSFSCAISRCWWFTSQSANRSYSYKMTKTLFFKNAIQSINN